jgi:dCMP deaminase
MIIGLTGSLAAGKGVVSDFFKGKGFVYLSLSDELRELLKENKIKLTRENLQEWGNKYREENGSDYLAKLVVDKINNQDYKRAIVDGIRNPEEVDFLDKNLKDFFLVSVDAPENIRFERMKVRARESDPTTLEGFRKVDKKDKGVGEKKSGQGVGKCMKKAKFVLINDCSLEDVQVKIEKLYDALDRMIPRPSWDEYFLGIMDAVAKRATCNRGRSGCVIARDKQLLVSGYVGSPVGVPHCDDVGHLMKKVVHEDGHVTNHCLRTTHAEQNAICQAAKLGIAIKDATLYCSMTPCSACAKMIINSGIKRVVCRKKYHAGQESEELFRLANITLVILEDDFMRY